MKNFSSHSNRLAILIALFILPVTCPFYGQEHFQILPDGQKIKIKNHSIHYSYETLNNKISSINFDQPDEMISVIVLFKSRPFSLETNSKFLGKYERIEQEHMEFKAALKILAARLQQQDDFSYNYNISHEYYHALNGIALTANRALVEDLLALPMVAGVSKDKKVTITLEHSVPQIRADLVQKQLSLTGKDVLVGILDTGIDYQHPALGGGIGKDYRIVGGYDFFNDDEDPMDGHGHGTHVAGIVGAASDSLIGVAPGVKLLAVKVLSDWGYGWDSDVLAGIEFCLNPDGDPMTDDAVDIMNMSFGSDPIPEDPVAIAIGNAAKAGVLSVVAAGNSGGENPFFTCFGTISSPGTAAQALTVGAIDSVNQVAVFSSKGPDLVNFAIKPEIMAPGVNIQSCFLNNNTNRFSGTSMAAPHVAGVAALLKELHPDWTVDQLKWAMVNSAQPLTGDQSGPYIYGNGRLDAWDATQIGLLIQPGILSFRAVDLSFSVWRDTIDFKIKNLLNRTRDLRLTLKHNLPIGAAIHLSRTAFLMMPFAEQQIRAIIEVNDSVPIINESPYAYYGHIICQADSDSMTIPFGFTKANVMIVEFEYAPFSEILFWNMETIQVEKFPTHWLVKKYHLHIPAGRYNVLTFMINRSDSSQTKYFIIEKQNLRTNGLNYLYIDSKDAKFQAFPDEIFDLDNQPVHDSDLHKHIALDLGQVQKIGSAIYRRHWSYVIGVKGEMDLIYMSPLDSNIIVSEIILASNANNILGLSQMHKGILNASDLAIPSGSANLTPICIEFCRSGSSSYPMGTEIALCQKNYGSGYGVHCSIISFQDVDNFKAALSQTQTIIDTSAGILYRSIFLAGKSEFDESIHKYQSFASNEFTVTEAGDWLANEISCARPDFTDQVVFYSLPANDTIKIGPENTEMNLPVYEVQFYRAVPELQMKPRIETYVFTKLTHDGIISASGCYYPGVSNEARVNLQLYSNNRLIGADSDWSMIFPGMLNFYFAELPGTFRLLGDAQAYRLLGQNGQVIIDTRFPFNTSGIPSLDLLQILANGRMTRWLKPGENGTVRLVVYDENKDLDQVGMTLVLSSGQEIHLDPVQISSKEFQAAIPDGLPHEFIDVQARVQDQSGNQFELNAGPAFFYGASLDEIKFDSRVRMHSYQLTNVNDISLTPGDTLAYKVRFVNNGNVTAKNIQLDLPASDYFRPVPPARLDLESLTVADTIQVSFKLVQTRVFGQPVSYDLPVTWSSNEKSYARKYRILIDNQLASGIAEQQPGVMPTEFKLYANYPNPFNATTRIRYDLVHATPVELAIYDVAGRQVRTLVQRFQQPGRYCVHWQGDNATGVQVASGVYFCQIKTNAGVRVGKLLLIK